MPKQEQHVFPTEIELREVVNLDLFQPVAAIDRASVMNDYDFIGINRVTPGGLQNFEDSESVTPGSSGR